MLGTPIPLTDDERALLRSVFGDALDVSRLRLRHGGIPSWGSTRAIGDTVYFQRSTRFAEIRTTRAGQALLVHEATHVWQYQTVGWRYAVGSCWDQLRAFLRTGDRHGAYVYVLDAARPLMSYGYEQQAQMVQERWQGRFTSCRNLDAVGEDGARAIVDRHLDAIRGQIRP